MTVKCASCLLSAVLAAPAHAADPTAPWQPPTLSTQRYDEHWADLADPANRTGRWTEPYKYIPLTDDGGTWLSTGIELRLRREAYDDNLWGSADAPDDAYLWARALPYADLHVGAVRAFVQPIVAYAAGVSPAAGPVDQSRVDLLQGFADVVLQAGDASLRLRAGRELIGLGSERLVGTRYGPNVPLAFDGGRAMLNLGSTTVNLLLVQPVEAGTRSFDDRSSPTRKLWGAYATRTTGFGGFDLYYLGYRNRAARFDQGQGRELRHSLGARSFGKVDAWHWNVEGIYQFGRFADAPIRAWSVATELGHAFAAAPLKPDLTLRFNVVSGDRHAGSRRLQTFNALFPKGKYFGELSPVGPYNIVNAQSGVVLDVGHDVGLGLTTMAYWRQSRGDGIYDIPGHLLRAANGTNARFIGKQAEASLSWQATPELELSGSLSAFAPGGFIRATGPAKTIHMLGLESNFRF
jgi:hypothetical protein